jgi:hypothetical protein
VEGLHLYVPDFLGGGHFVCRELLQKHEQYNTNFQVRPQSLPCIEGRGFRRAGGGASLCPTVQCTLWGHIHS